MTFNEWLSGRSMDQICIADLEAAWDAATKAEREACLEVCEKALSQKLEGASPYYVNGREMGLLVCREMILDRNSMPSNTSSTIHPKEVHTSDGRSSALADRLVGRRVVCAANRNPDTHDMLLGARHFDHLMIQAGGPRTRSFTEQGFIDQHGVFMSRTEAWRVAEAAGQIIRRCGGDDANGGTLYSENLY